MFAAQFGEQTYIRYGKSKGGLVGLTLSEEPVARWVLFNSIFTLVSFSMDKMLDEGDDEYDATRDIHTEEGKSRIKLDAQDRTKFFREMETHPNPLQTDTNNIVNR